MVNHNFDKQISEVVQIFLKIYFNKSFSNNKSEKLLASLFCIRDSLIQPLIRPIDDLLNKLFGFSIKINKASFS